MSIFQSIQGFYLRLRLWTDMTVNRQLVLLLELLDGLLGFRAEFSVNSDLIASPHHSPLNPLDIFALVALFDYSVLRVGLRLNVGVVDKHRV